VDLLVSRGARHHIFSAISGNLADEVRRIVASDPSALNRRQSRNENHRTPLHFAVFRNRPAMIELLLELGADPLAVDGSGQPVAIYAEGPDIDRPVMEKIRAMTAAEILSAERGYRSARAEPMDLLALLALGDFDGAERLLVENRTVIAPRNGVLHLMAKRGDRAAVKWLLDHGADVNGTWPHWDADVTPLHLAASRGHADVVRLLLAAHADPSIHDSKHDSDVLGWAEFFRQPEIVTILNDHRGIT
jgi:ankyrin repeat protein